MRTETQSTSALRAPDPEAGCCRRGVSPEKPEADLRPMPPKRARCAPIHEAQARCARIPTAQGEAFVACASRTARSRRPLPAHCARDAFRRVRFAHRRDTRRCAERPLRRRSRRSGRAQCARYGFLRVRFAHYRDTLTVRAAHPTRAGRRKEAATSTRPRPLSPARPRAHATPRATRDRDNPPTRTTAR